MSATLEAGRELDALVAEKVMGWTRALKVKPPNRSWPLRGTRTWISPAGPHVRALPRYSTEIGAAWDVAKNVAARGWKIDVQNRYRPTWACHVNFPSPDQRRVFTHTNSAAHAICLAALEAVGAIPLNSYGFPRIADECAPPTGDQTP